MSMKISYKKASYGFRRCSLKKWRKEWRFTNDIHIQYNLYRVGDISNKLIDRFAHQSKALEALCLFRQIDPNGYYCVTKVSISEEFVREVE